jgi:hypothetical protein
MLRCRLVGVGGGLGTESCFFFWHPSWLGKRERERWCGDGVSGWVGENPRRRLGSTERETSLVVVLVGLGDRRVRWSFGFRLAAAYGMGIDGGAA